MKKAFDALNQANISYEFHDYKKLGIDVETLTLWLNELGADSIVNKKGTTWRKLTESEQQYALANDAQLVETLMQHTSLIKRPILKTDTGWIVGFSEQQYQFNSV